MRKFCILLFLLLSSINSFAQSDAWYMNKPIKEIDFQGLQHVTITELSGFKTQFIGKPYSDSLFRDMQSKLFALDYFKKFRAEAEPGDKNKNSVVIIFTVEEKPVIDKIVIKGNNNVSKTNILDVVLLKQDDIFSKSKLRTDEKAIKDLYLDKGYPDVEVTSETEENSEKKLVTVTFNVNEGNQTRIKDIFFSGNNFATDSVLRGLLSLKKQRFLQSGVFKSNKLEEDKAAIVKYYTEHGYIDAKVVQVKKDLEKGDNGKNYLILTFYIDEGSQWFFGGIQFEGNVLFSDEELKSTVRLKEGDILNKIKLNADYAKIADLYYNDGYIFNDINLVEKRENRDKTIHYTVKITEKERAHIENIIIKGNVKTKDKVIFREIPLVPGDVFSKDKVIEGIQNLYNTGLFSTIAPETPFGSTEGLMDLVINVEEGKNTDIQFGITFTGTAGTFPMVGFLKWNDRNFRGMGETLSIGTNLSTKTQDLTLGFSNNWIMGKRWSGGVNFSIRHLVNENIKQDILPVRFTEDDYNNNIAAPDPYNSYSEYAAATENGETIDSSYLMSYDSYEISSGLNTGYTFHTPVGRLSTGTGLKTSLNNVHYDPDIYRPYNPSVRNNLDTWLFNNKMWFNLGWDTRDFVLNPGKGFFLNQIITYAGGLLGGNSNYIKSQSKAEAFFTLANIEVSDSYTFKSILALHSAYSVVFPQYFYTKDTNSWDWDMQATTNDLLFTEGMTLARGWTPMQDGQAMWDNWVELRMPISEKVLWADIFLSGTGFWEDRDQVKDISLQDFKFSTGTGIRFVIPGLPIGLYFTKRFQFNQDNSIEWQGGSIFKDPNNENSGLDLVIAFTIGLF